MRRAKISPVLLGVVVLALGAVACAQPAAGPSQKAEPKGQFLRLVRDEDNRPVALEAAIVRCVPLDRRKTGPVVDLVAAVHVAEKGYYQRLNREFARYDAVLYELVASEGAKLRRGRPANHPLSMVQRAIKNLLELEFQLEQINYNRENMVHADMSPEQFAKSMRQRGESMWTVFLRMLGYALARQQGSGGPTDAQLLAALFDKDRALALKRVMAEQFQDLEGSISAIEGPDGSTMISERNKVALGALRKQLAAGKRKIAIFYGAGHMADLRRRLRDQFRLAPVSTRWLVAWNLKSAPAPKPKRRGNAARP